MLRIEYKYFIPHSKSSQLLNDLNQFCRPDRHGKGGSGGYKVASIYLDQFNMRGYHQKIEGQNLRTKVRLRFYPSDKTRNSYLEFKQKIFDRIDKQKTFAGDYSVFFNTAVPKEEDNDLILNMEALKRYTGLKPVVRVDYMRNALFSKTDSTVRVTLDTNVVCARFKGDHSQPHIKVFPAGLDVLEIKSPGHMPYYLSRVIDKYRLQRSAISKYASAIQSISTNSSFTF